nr:ATP-binding protein [Variibacter gotjawalensis]
MELQRSGVREIDDIAEELERSAYELREREAELLRVQQIGRVGGLEVDLRNGFRNKRSPEYLRIHGLPPDAVRETHESWVARIHPDDREETERHFRDAVKSTDTEYKAEYRIIRPSDGALRWISAKAELERDPEGRALRLIGAHTDITEIKEAETALQRLNEGLEAQVEERSQQVAQLQKLEAIGQLTGGVAHDFNNLLTAIVGNLELLKKRMPDDPRLHRLIDNALKGSERGAALTQRLLAFARRQELRPEAVDVARLVEGMSELLRRALGAMIEIETAVPTRLSPAKVDANQFELAILNLAVNGRDAMPNGGKLTISARDETYHGLGDIADGDYIVISVIDTGEGMDEATLRRATEPFFTTKGVGKGTGLGLSMVHGLAAQSGGKLRLRSEIGEGTVAELWLPRAEADEIAKSVAVPEPLHPTPTRRRVLVVDDDALVLAGTSAILEDMKHHVVEAASARQALEILRKEPSFDIVVTDHAMPGMTGTELAATIAREWPALPVILATGYADLPEGAAPDLPRLGKPFGQVALAQAIESTIAAHGAPQIAQSA